MSKSAEAFRTISEVADLLETPTHVLRFWESRFPQIKPVKRAGGRRYYRPDDVMLLGGIKKLLHEQGLAIRGVQKILKDEGVRAVMALSGLELGSEEDGADVAQSVASLIQAAEPAPGAEIPAAPTAQAPPAEPPESEPPQAEAPEPELPPLAPAPAPEPPTAEALFPRDPELPEANLEAAAEPEPEPAPTPPPAAAPRAPRIIRPTPVRKGGWQQGSLFDDPAEEPADALLESDSPASAPEEAPEAPFAFDVPEEPAAPAAPAQVVSLMIPTRAAPPAPDTVSASPPEPTPLTRLAQRLAALAPGALSAQERTRLVIARERLRTLARRLGPPPKSA